MQRRRHEKGSPERCLGQSFLPFITAEKTGRICRGVELDPLYVDVIVRRFEAATGIAEMGEILDTVELDRGAFARVLRGHERRTLFMVCQNWVGPENWASGPRTAQVAAVDAAAPGAGWR
jgi:hypothetical protein